jgi:hypothetical protein
VLSKNVQRLKTLEQRTIGTTFLTVLTFDEWQALLDVHNRDEYAARKAVGGYVVLVQKQADKDSLKACLEAVKPSNT